MNFIEIVIIAVVLAMDASAVSLAAAASGYVKKPRAALRMSFHFAFFQFLMPIFGWVLGRSAMSFVASFDHLIAFILLIFVGSKMIRSGLKSSEKRIKTDPSRSFTLIILSIATSIDAFAIGLSLAMLEVSIWYPSVIIGVITAILCMVAIKLGNKLKSIFGKRMEFFGGILLIVIGIRILLSHLIV